MEAMKGLLLLSLCALLVLFGSADRGGDVALGDLPSDSVSTQIPLSLGGSDNHYPYVTAMVEGIRFG